MAIMFVIGKNIFPGERSIINHKDGVKWHNEPYNLEWTTDAGNAQHANANNLINRPFGEHNGWSRLTDEQYHQICKLTQEGYLPNQINNIMGLDIDITNIAKKIRTGKSESPIAAQYDFSNIPRNDYKKFTEQQVRFICECFQDRPELDYTSILELMGIDIWSMDNAQRKKLRDTLSTIKRRVSYIEIAKDYKF